MKRRTTVLTLSITILLSLLAALSVLVGVDASTAGIASVAAFMAAPIALSILDRSRRTT